MRSAVLTGTGSHARSMHRYFASTPATAVRRPERRVLTGVGLDRDRIGLAVPFGRSLVAVFGFGPDVLL